MSRSEKATKSQSTPEIEANALLHELATKTARRKELLSSIQSELDELDDGMNEIERQLLNLATENRKTWFPGEKKTVVFENGELVFRASSKLVEKDGNPVDELNTDLLGLAKRKGCRSMVKITPVLSQIKAFIKAGRMPSGFEGISIEVTDKFSTKPYALEQASNQ